MSEIQSIALRGLNNAVGRVTTAASTIARAGTGLPAAEKAAPVAAGAIYQQNGLNPQQLSGISDDNLVSAAVDLKIGQAAYAANAAVIRSQNDLEREFIRDIRI